MVEDETRTGSAGAHSAAFDEPDLTGLTQDQFIDLFVNNLVEEKGQNISETEKQQIADDLKDAVMTEILMSLPDYLVNKINDRVEYGTAS